MKWIFLLLLTISCSKKQDSYRALSSSLESSFESERINTDAILIQKNDQLLYEKYFRGYNKNQKHLSWSMAKTISGILVGIAIDEGYLKYSDKLHKFFPKFKGEATILDLLQMSSGIEFEETYGIGSDVTKMLYTKGPGIGFAEYTLSRPLREKKAGTSFYYSSGDTNILMAVLKKVMPDKVYKNYPWDKFFNPLNIDATFELDSSGTFVGSSYTYMKAYDFLKVGKLLVDKGFYNNEKVIPTEYYKKLSEVSLAVKNDLKFGSMAKGAYTMQVRTNLAIKDESIAPRYKSLPEDSFLFYGHQGQIIVASPSENLIIVRLATDQGASLDKDLFYEKATGLVKEKYPDFKQAETTSSFLYKNINEEAFKSKEKDLGFGEIVFEYATNSLKLVQRLASKEYCSCISVIKRSRELCLKDLALTIKPNFLIPNIKKVGNKFLASWFGNSLYSESEFLGNKLGCRIKVGG